MSVTTDTIINRVLNGKVRFRDYIIDVVHEGRPLQRWGGKSGHHRADCPVERLDAAGQTCGKDSATESKPPSDGQG